MEDRIIGLCVGHSRLLRGRPEGGAVAADGKTNEWNWNSGLARQIAEVLHDLHGITALIVDDYGPHGYGEAMRRLGKTLADEGVSLAVELHFNAAQASANGHEWLYWNGSTKGRLAATELHLAMCKAFPGIKARGVKSLTAKDRGAMFVRETWCPAIIAEPFFGSNKNDFAIVSGDRTRLADAIADGLASALHRI